MRTQNEQTAHTPGPWHILPQVMDSDTERHAMACNPYAFRRHIATHPDVEDPECRIVCDMRDGPDGDAHLIAAAPDLLDALERLEAGVRLWMSRGVYNEDMDAARAAIAKARGGFHEAPCD